MCAWSQFCEAHPDMRVVWACFENMPPRHFWFLANEYPDLVTRMHTQVRVMGSFGLNGSIPWLRDTDVTLSFMCKGDIENLDHFLLPSLR